MDPDSEPPSYARPRSHAGRLAGLALATAAVSACAATQPWAAGASLRETPGALYLAGALAGFAGSILFTILQHALFVLETEDLEALRYDNPRAADRILALRENLDVTWFTLLAGALLSRILLTLAVAGAVLRGTGTFSGWPAALAAFAAALVAVFLLGEVLPGLLAARWLRPLAPFSARTVRMALLLLSPLVYPCVGLIRLARRSDADGFRERLRQLDVEMRLLTWVGLGKVDVSLENEEREMIDHAIEFGNRTAGEIMRPRREIRGFDASTPQEEALRGVRESDSSRLIVYDRSLDEIVGVLHAKHALLDAETDYHEHLFPASFVPESMELVDLMAYMKSRQRQLVVVLDEYGATAGVVTMQDLLQEIVGPVQQLDGGPEAAA